MLRRMYVCSDRRGQAQMPRMTARTRQPVCGARTTSRHPAEYFSSVNSASLLIDSEGRVPRPTAQSGR